MIKTILRLLLILSLIAIVGTGVLAAIGWAALDGTALTIDGEGVALSGLQAWHPVAAIAVVVVAAMVGVAVAILAVVFGLVCTALGLGIAALAIAGSLGLVAAPFLLVGWLIWHLLRPRPTSLTTPPSALPAA